MKDILTIAALTLLLTVSGAKIANSQQVTQKQIEVSWQVDNAEPDVQHYQLYVSNTGEAGSFGPAGDRISFSPNAQNNPARLSTSYTFPAPVGQVTRRWFTVTAIDTSGNESQPATPIEVVVDQEPPGPPQGLTVTVVIQVTP